MARTPDTARSLELAREFVELADVVLANPAVRSGLSVSISFVADEDRSGRGTWSMTGPDELHLKALLLDLRNFTQPGSDLHLSKVLRSLSTLVPDDGARRALEDAQERLQKYGEVGITTENGRRVQPYEIVDLFFYSLYHHRDLTKRRRIKAMYPVKRMIYRMEFIEWVGNICAEVAYLRYEFVGAAQGAGYLVELAETKEPPAV